VTNNGTLVNSVQVAVPASAVSMAKRNLSTLDFQRFSAVTLHAITYMSDGLKINGWLTLPPASAELFPAIVFNRGGSGPRAALTAEGAMAFIGLYAAWGYVGVATNYRGVGGSEGAEESWGELDVQDALNLIPLLDSFPYVDKDRLGVVGGSRGGMVTYLMLKETNRFRAAVSIGAPASLHSDEHGTYIRKTMTKHLPPNSVEQTEAEKRSAELWVADLPTSTPLLVLHGTGDRRVSPAHSLQLASALQKIHFPYKLVMYDNADHVLAGRRKESNGDIRWWLDHYVSNKAPLPKSGPHGA